MKRLTVVILLSLLALTASAGKKSTTYVCSLTGKKMESCCCKTKKNGQQYCTLAKKTIKTCCCKPPKS